MKPKVIVAITALCVIVAALLVATASAFMVQPNTSSVSATGWSFGPFHFDDGRGDFGEGEMMNRWGPYTQNNTIVTPFSGDEWGWHG